MTVTSLHERATKQASAIDCRWFEQHPGRVYRMRAIVKWEVPHRLTDKPAPKGTSWRMIVAQVPNFGIRFKVQVGVTDNVPPEDMDDEALRDLFRNFAPPFLVEQHEHMLAALYGGPQDDGAEEAQGSQQEHAPARAEERQSGPHDDYDRNECCEQLAGPEGHKKPHGDGQQKPAVKVMTVAPVLLH